MLCVCCLFRSFLSDEMRPFVWRLWEVFVSAHRNVRFMRPKSLGVEGAKQLLQVIYSQKDFDRKVQLLFQPRINV